MNYDYAQRRRVAVAAALTVILVPAAFLLDDRSDTSSTSSIPPVTAVGTIPGSAPSGTAPAITTPLGTAPSGFVPDDTTAVNAEPPRIAVPQLPESVKGLASFSSAIDSTTRCQAKGVPFNATLTVTNLDNARSVRCVASIGGAEPVTDVVLATDTFAEIADLTDAPVPVQITWVAA